MSDAAYSRLELWFFRDMSDDQRCKLLGLFGLPDNRTHGWQRIALKRIVRELRGAALSGTREAVEPVGFTVPYTLELLRQGRGTTAPLCPTRAPDYHPLCTVPLYAAPPSDPVGQGAVTDEEIDRRAKFAADAVGVTPHSDMRLFVERAVKYALATPANTDKEAGR